VEGKPLEAGTYGLHMIPTRGQWTVIFSSVSSAWGSFSYDETEDALRVSVTPVESPFQERLGYTLEEPSNRGASIVMRWEKLAVPIKVEVDTPTIVAESLRKQLRGIQRFGWQGWNQAANYCLQNGVNLEEAVAWADRSIQMNENFTNLRTKAGLVEKSGDTKTAEALRTKAMTIATEADINAYGYELLGQGKTDEAIAMFQKNVRDYPKSWNTYDSLGEAYDIKGDKKLAAENYRKARAMVQDADNKKRIDGILKRLGA
jgi:tetratricopeptide (TPR) repeat protein